MRCESTVTGFELLLSVNKAQDGNITGAKTRFQDDLKDWRSEISSTLSFFYLKIILKGIFATLITKIYLVDLNLSLSPPVNIRKDLTTINLTDFLFLP